MMARRESTMYAEKRFELETMKDRLMELFENNRYSVPKFREKVFYDFGKTKTLLLVFEEGVVRGRDYDRITLMILLTEHDGYQGADVIINPWLEDQLLLNVVDAFKDLGFMEGKPRPRFNP